MHALLVLEADQTIKNDENLIANDLALQVYGQPLSKLRLVSEVTYDILLVKTHSVH